MSQLTLEVPQFFPFQRQLTKDQQEVLDVVNARFDSVLKVLLTWGATINRDLGIGHPASDEQATASVQPTIDNLHGSWHTQKFTTLAQLGSAITVTHNLDLPVTTYTAPGSTTIQLPNVRILVENWMYGDKTETDPVAGNRTVATAAPTAAPNFQSGQIWFKTGDTVTTNTIQYRFYSSINPASIPLYVDFLLIPAVR